MAVRKRKVNGEIAKSNAGRPPKINDDVLNKLEHAFSIGCTDEEACSYADISTQTLYDYQHLNPQFIGRKEHLKKKPFIKARQTIITNLGSFQGASWFAERKMRNEFGKSTEEAPVQLHKNTYNFIFSNEVRERVRMIDGDIKKLLTQPYDSKIKEDVGLIEERPKGAKRT